MPSYTVKGRKTGPVTVVSVTAETTADAIAQVTATAQPGEEVDIMAVELVPEEAPPEGGATGDTGATGATGTSRRSR